MTTDAVVMDLSKLATQADSGGVITNKEILNFNAPLLDVSRVVSIVKATDMTVKDVSAIANAGKSIYALALKNMTILHFLELIVFLWTKLQLYSQLLLT